MREEPRAGLPIYRAVRSIDRLPLARRVRAWSARLGRAGTLGQGRAGQGATDRPPQAWPHVARSISIGSVDGHGGAHFKHGARSRRAHRFRVVSRLLALSLCFDEEKLVTTTALLCLE
jgi:hypothetical protein